MVTRGGNFYKNEAELCLLNLMLDAVFAEGIKWSEKVPHHHAYRVNALFRDLKDATAGNQPEGLEKSQFKEKFIRAPAKSAAEGIVIEF